MRQGRAVAILWGVCVLALAGWACESTPNPGGFQKDLIPPTISLTTSSGKGLSAANPDTQLIGGGLNLTVGATDNLALNDIRLVFSGGFIDTTDTIFSNQTLKTVTLPVHITFPANSGAGRLIQIVGRASDGAGNSAQDTLFIFLVNVNALSVNLLSPGPGALASAGRSIPVEVVATQKSGIRKVGFIVTPAAATTNPTPPNDSISYAVPYPDSVDYVDTVTVVQATGTFTITGFAEDSSGRRSTTNTILVTVQSPLNDVTKPSVTDSIGTRIEVSDSVKVHATDPSAITWIGFRVRRASDSLVLRFDTIPVGGGLTDVTRRFSLNLAGLITVFTPPTSILVDGYACDGAAGRNCGFSTLNGVVTAAAHADSAQVVAGVSRPLPVGGHISDAIFDANRGELYLTNTPLSRVEVFQVANSSFVAGGIATAGPQPWGIALWPHDTLGGYGDSIVVADAGGTEMSVIDVVARRLKWRQDLPNYQINLYKVIQVAGAYTAQITVHDVSDRPQYIGTVCRVVTATTGCHADSIYVLYSTTPTQSSSSPFSGKGTLRMEKLINTNLLTFPADTTQLFGHFFWEIGNLNASDVSDTLQIVLRRGRPYNQTSVILSACAGVTINFETFGLGDSTYTRNSGNFTHGFFGEGGNAAAAFRRVMSYTSKGAHVEGSPTFKTCETSPDTLTGPVDAGNNDVDFGMSPAVDVSDFISNTGANVSAIATNFNGGTNLVRADSIYFLDEGLRLKGTSLAPTGAPGMDMNYSHDFQAGQGGSTGLGGTRDSTNRVVFAADPSGNILIFDTFFYNQIGSIPVRDPIVGPLRVAKDALGNQLLFGVTARGLVMVRLPIVPNPNPAPPPPRVRTLRTR